MFVKEISGRHAILETPAKVNLFLQVLNKRPDGFHNINSLFQAVSLYDRLEIKLIDSPGVRIQLSDGPDVPLDGNNLIARAYQLMRGRFDLRQGLEISLEKKIPVAAGLAGGSSDAAATLKACNLLFQLGLSQSELSLLGLEIGSDLPFFFSSGQALVKGRGDIISEVDFPTDYVLVLVTPPLGISTAEAYAALKRGLTTSTIEYNLHNCRTVEEFVSSLISSGNDFEEVLSGSLSVLDRIRQMLLGNGALLTRMSGSGPTLFGVFSTKPEIKERMILNQGEWLIHTVKPISLPGQDKHLEGGDRGDY